MKEPNSTSKIPQLATQSITGTQSLRDILAFLKKSKNFLTLKEKPNGVVFWNNVPIEALEENRVIIKDEENDISTIFRADFNKTKLTTEAMNDVDK